MLWLKTAMPELVPSPEHMSLVLIDASVGLIFLYLVFPPLWLLDHWKGYAPICLEALSGSGITAGPIQVFDSTQDIQTKVNSLGTEEA